MKGRILLLCLLMVLLSLLPAAAIEPFRESFWSQVTNGYALSQATREIDSFDRVADNLDLGYTETTDGAVAVPWAKPAEADTTTEILDGWLKLSPCVTGCGVSLGHQFQPTDLDMSAMLRFTAEDGQQWAGLAYRQALICTYDQIDDNRLSPGQTAADKGYLVYARQDGSGIDLRRDGAVIASAKFSPGARMDWYAAPRKLRIRALGAHHEVFVSDPTDPFNDVWEKVIDYYDFNGKTSGGFIGIMRTNATVFVNDFKCYAYRGPLCQITGTVTNTADPYAPIAGAQIRFADGSITTTDANGVYTTSVGSATGKTSLQVVANTYRQSTYKNISVSTSSPTTYNFTLAKLPNPSTLNWAQVPGPRWDTFSRPDCGGNTLDGSVLGFTEDGNFSRGNYSTPPVRGGLGFSFEGLSDSVRMRTQIKNQMFVLPYCAPNELGRGMGMVAMISGSYPIDGDFIITGESDPLTEPGDYIGLTYRSWPSGAWQFHGYAMQCFADGKIKLVYNHGNEAVANGAWNPYQPVVVATYQFPTVPDWTKPHKFRVRFEGPRHQAWVDNQQLWDVQDWGWMEYGYVGAIHQNAEFRTDNWLVAFDSGLPGPPWYPPVTIPDAKKLADGTLVELTGASVVTGAFTGFFYVEDESRASGIKVVSTKSVSVGDAVTVSGSIKTANGERCIQATSVTVDSHPGELRTLGLTNKSNAPAAGLNNIGLLTKVWGKVTGPDPIDTFCVVDDGSGTPVKVLIGGTLKPAIGNTVGCAGVASKDTDGTPVIRMRSNGDLTIY